MQLEAGASLGHYEIIGPLGKGGMGEVYRAKDVKLGREVAIKVLPEEFTTDAERLGRFDREARLLASLNHPHIASIHGFEDAGGWKFLVMELAEGMTLADRLRQGSIPIEEATAIARQIVGALESAHEKGIIHRDLKPANIVIDDEGKVKVLDFGLAKALDVEESSANDLTNSPTMVRAATHAGVILGTSAYMSPEQAKGKKVDQKADVWSFGVVLFEMLTGERLFDGETVSETLAAVIMKEIDLDRVPKGTPSNVRRLLRRCLTKNPKDRLQAIGEARIALDEEIESESVTSVADGRRIAPRPIREIVAWGIAGVLVAIVGILALQKRSSDPLPQKPIAARLAVFGDPNLVADGGSSVVVSTEGDTIVFVATHDGVRRLYMQQTSAVGVVPIPGTEGAQSPFFSPDGTWIAFFSGGQLKKVPTSGGAPFTICNVIAPRGGTWGEKGSIVMSERTSGGLSIVSADGGRPEPLTTLDEAKSERSHRWPQFLPGGNEVLYMAQKQGGNYEDATIQVVSVETRESKVVHSGGSYPRYARSGHLLFARGGVLFALPFDLASLTTSGSPKPVLQEIFGRTGNEATDDGTSHYDLSSDGMIVYRHGPSMSDLSQMTIVDSQGNRVATSRSNHYLFPAMAPDGRRIAVVVQEGSGSDIWVWDTRRDTLSRLTFEDGDVSAPVWSPDGRRIAYISAREDERGIVTNHLFVKPADGSGSEQSLGKDLASGIPTSWSQDGRTILCSQVVASGGVVDIMAISIEGEEAGKRRDVITGPAVEIYGDLSPDGKWIAYESNESGQPQIYVRPFFGPGGKWQISVDGGDEPSWINDGKEIVWRNEARGHWKATIGRDGKSLVIGEPTTVPIEGRFLALPPFKMWDVSDDGERYVFLVGEEKGEIESKTVILQTNWFEELHRLMPRE